MKLITLTFLFLLSPQVFAQAKKKIMVSYFKPFGEFSENHTVDVAKAIKDQFGKDKNLEIVLCPLSSNEGIPTTFHSSRTDIATANGASKLKGKSAFEALKECYHNNPDVEQVISLGEGTCYVQTEATSRNQMSTGFNESMKDNDGNYIPGTEKIISEGSDFQKTDDVNIIAVCLEQQTKGIATYYSNDPGIYVCNNLIYNFLAYANHNKLPISYSFVHVPPHLDRAGVCGDMNGFKKSNDEVLTNALLTSRVAEQVGSFIKQKDNVLKTFFSPKKSERQSEFYSYCTDKVSEPKLDALQRVSDDAYEKLKTTSFQNLLTNPAIQQCIKENKKVRDYAPVFSGMGS